MSPLLLTAPLSKSLTARYCSLLKSTMDLWSQQPQV